MRWVTGTIVTLLIVAGLLLFAAEPRPTLASRPARDRIQVADTALFLPLLTQASDPTYRSPFGVVIYGSLGAAAGVPEMEAAGARWVTTSLDWSSIEPQKGVRNWSSFDAKAEAAQDAGMDLFVLFTGNPSWAAELPGGPVYNIQDLVSFVTAMAERYDCDGLSDAPSHPCVFSWSFYAEPDNGDYNRAINGKGYWGHNGAGYAAMLSHVTPALRGANPRSRVMIGGLAYDFFEEDGGPYVRRFLADTLDALQGLGGIATYLDAVAFHYYPISPQLWPTIADKAAEIQGIMQAHGAGSLPLLCPEMGYWSSPTFGSSEDQQARRLVQMFVRGYAAGVQMSSWYKVYDASGDDYPDRSAGLFRVDKSPKPSYYAYQTMTRELEGLHYKGLLNAPGAEGYVYRMGGGRTKTVVWSRAGTIQVVFPFTHLRLVNTLGQEYDIQDNQQGQPGDKDGGVVGQIALEIYENQPVYVEQK